MEQAGKLQLLQEMYQQWPFFSVTLDMVEMVMAKSDPRVAQFYENALVDKKLWSLGDELRTKYGQTKQALLKASSLRDSMQLNWQSLAVACLFRLLVWMGLQMSITGCFQ